MYFSIDITRPVPNKLFLEQMILKFINAEISLENILIIATGLHRPASQSEIADIGSTWVLKILKLKTTLQEMIYA